MLKTLNLGVIGLGQQGKTHLRNCLHLRRGRLWSVADVSKRNVNLAKRMGVKNVYTNYEDLLKDARLDAVIVTLPNYLHHEAAIKAAEAGKDIFLEKPLARNVEEGEEIVASVRKNGVKLMLGYDMRFNPVLRRIQEEIHCGFFGKVQIVDTTNVGSGPFMSRSESGGPTPVPSWWFDKELVGGGALLDLGSHLINLLSWYFGKVIDVKSYLGYIYNMELEDTAICILHFKDGPLATVKVGWFSKHNTQSIHICGTAENLLVRLSPSSTTATIWKDLKRKAGMFQQDPFYLELEYFVECLQKDEPPNPSGEEGLNDLRIISLAYKNMQKLAL